MPERPPPASAIAAAAWRIRPQDPPADADPCLIAEGMQHIDDQGVNCGVADLTPFIDDPLRAPDEPSQKARRWLLLYWRVTQIRALAAHIADSPFEHPSPDATASFRRQLDLANALRDDPHLSPESAQAVERYRFEIFAALAEARASDIFEAFKDKDPKTLSPEEKSVIAAGAREVQALFRDAEYAIGPPDVNLERRRLWIDLSLAQLRDDTDAADRAAIEGGMLALGPTGTKLERQPWYRVMSSGDRSRVIELIIAARQEASGAGSAKRALIRRTVEFMLSPTPSCWLEFSRQLPFAAKVIPVEEKTRTELSLPRVLLNADFFSREDQAQLSRTAVLVDEMNRVYCDPSLPLFDREYSDYVVQFVMQRDRLPSRQECHDIARSLFTNKNFSEVQRVFFALGADGRPTPEAQKIIAFMNQFYEQPFAVDDPASPHKIIDDLPPVKDPNDPGPLPVRSHIDARVR